MIAGCVGVGLQTHCAAGRRDGRPGRLSWRPQTLDLANVETVPVEPSRVDGVFEDRAYRGLCPLPGGVAAGVHMLRRLWAAWAIEVVGDLLEAVPGEVALEDFHDDGRLLGIGD